MTEPPSRPPGILIAPLPSDSLAEVTPSLIDLYFAAYAPQLEYAYETREEVAEYIGWLHPDDPGGFVVARVDGAPAGWCSVNASWLGWRKDLAEPIGEIQELVVAPAFQGHGIGQRFVEFAIERSTLAGRKVLGLWVGEHNGRAKALYERNGFVEESRWRIWIRMIRQVSVSVGSQASEGLGE